MESQIQKKASFDLQTHIFDKSGSKLLRKNLYRMHKIGDKTYYERPVDSGNLWYENNEPAGRVIYQNQGKKVVKKFLVGDEAVDHVKYEPPLSGTEKFAREHQTVKERLAAAEAELAAIKKEREPAKKEAK